MRDPARIEPMLSAIRSAWYGNPDMRLGQLVCNASRVAECGVDPFSTEDDAMRAGLGLLAENRSSHTSPF